MTETDELDIVYQMLTKAKLQVYMSKNRPNIDGIYISVNGAKLRIWPDSSTNCTWSNICRPDYIKELKKQMKICTSHSICYGCEYFEGVLQ